MGARSEAPRAYATHDEAENAPGRLTQVQRVELVAEV